MSVCEHERFTAAVNVGRIVDDGQPTRFVADCHDHLHSVRRAVPVPRVESGLHFERPTVSVDGLELHAPIEPEVVKVLAQSSRYTMPPEIPHR